MAAAQQTIPTAAQIPVPFPTGPSRNAGARLAAILLTSVGDDNCAAVLRHLNEDQVHSITREIGRLSAVADDERQNVLRKFEDNAKQAKLFGAGGLEYAKSVLISAFGPETGKRMAERVVKSLGTETTGIDSLQKADPQNLAKVLQSEHPQAIALVLSHLEAAQAAKLLAALPADARAEVVRRMAALDQISPDVIHKIAKNVGERLRLSGEANLESYGGIKAVADVLNRVDSSVSDVILAEIADSDPALGDSVRTLMFVFDDLLNVDAQAMRTLLGKLERKTLILALKGCSPQLKNHFTTSMSSSAASILFEDMEALGPVRIREVEEAQQAVIAVARQLEAEGTLSLKAGNDEYVV